MEREGSVSGHVVAIVERCTIVDREGRKRVIKHNVVLVCHSPGGEDGGGSARGGVSVAEDYVAWLKCVDGSAVYPIHGNLPWQQRWGMLG